MAFTPSTRGASAPRLALIRRSSPWDIHRIRLFITADLIGRSLGNLDFPAVFVMGSERSAEVRDVLNRLQPPGRTRSRPPGGRSRRHRGDYGPFRDFRIPFLFFSTGEHPDYHAPRHAGSDRLPRVRQHLQRDPDHGPGSGQRRPRPCLGPRSAPDLEEVKALACVTRLLLDADGAGTSRLSDLQRAFIEQVHAKTSFMARRGTVTAEERVWVVRAARSGSSSPCSDDVCSADRLARLYIRSARPQQDFFAVVRRLVRAAGGLEELDQPTLLVRSQVAELFRVHLADRLEHFVEEFQSGGGDRDLDRAAVLACGGSRTIRFPGFEPVEHPGDVRAAGDQQTSNRQRRELSRIGRLQDPQGVVLLGREVVVAEDPLFEGFERVSYVRQQTQEHFLLGGVERDAGSVMGTVEPFAKIRGFGDNCQRGRKLAESETDRAECICSNLVLAGTT